MRRMKLTKDQRNKIAKMWVDGIKGEVIASETSVPLSSVYNVTKQIPGPNSRKSRKKKEFVAVKKKSQDADPLFDLILNSDLDAKTKVETLKRLKR